MLKLKNYNVLYVDDEKENLRALKSLFRKTFNITTTTSGLEGLEILKSNDFDLIITDQRMPEMTGIEFLKKVKLQWPLLKSVLLTAYENHEVIKEAINDVGVNWYLSKPFDPDQLENIIRNEIEAKISTVKIKEQEGRFRATFEQAAVGIAHISPEGSFLRVNQKLCDIVGYTYEEMFELTFQDITHPDDLELDLDNVNKLLEGELHTYSMEKRYFHKNGSIVWINLTVSLLRTSANEPDYFISVIEEISDKKATESQLRESEEKFRSLMEQSPLSLLICDKEGRIVDVNKAWLNLWNLTEEDLPAVKENYNLLHDAGAAKLGMLPLIERAFKGETIMLPEIEYESVEAMETMGLSNEKAKSIWLKGQLYPVKDEVGNIKNIISIEEDITERKQAEMALQVSEENLLLAQKIAHIGNWSWSIKEDIITWSDEVYNIYGLEIGSKINLQTLTSLIHPEDIEAHNANIEAWITKGENTPFEYRVIRPDGELRYIYGVGLTQYNQDGEAIFLLGTLQDITSDKNAQILLEESENKFRALFNRGGYAMGLSKIADRRAIMVNEAWLKLFGYAKELDIVGKFLSDFIAPEERDNYEEIADLHKTDTAPSYDIIKGLRKDNTTFDMEMRVTIFEMKGEKYALAMMTDITEQKLNEKQILEYQARLKALTVELTLAEEKQNKQIATDLHDQVGQLLASSRLQIAALDSSMAKSEILAKNKVISKGLVVAIQATRDAIFNLSPPQLNEIGLFAAISDWLDIEIEAKHNLKTRLTGDDIIYNLTEDLRFLLFRCTRELVFNVVKHAHASYVLTSIKKNKENIEIKVIDDGLGFNYDPAIFKTNNIGYGLFSIQERIENYGGIIKIDSALGKGTEVKLSVPLKKET